MAAPILAARAALSTDDPELQIAARALLGLWHVQADSLRKHLGGARAPARLHELVTSDVRRAARRDSDPRLLGYGLAPARLPRAY